MERITILIQELTYYQSYSYTDDEAARHLILCGLIEKYGQVEDVLVAKLDQKFVVVRGDEIVKAMSHCKQKQIQCLNFGLVDNFNLIALRLFFNVKESRLNYISIAEDISRVCKKNSDCAALANASGLSFVDIKRYSQLLNFNWDEFEKLQIDTGDKNLFGESVTILDNAATKKKMGAKHIENIKKRTK